MGHWKVCSFSLWMHSIIVFFTFRVTLGRNQLLKTDSNTYILRTYDGKAKKINNLNTPEVLGYMGNVDSISVADLEKLTPAGDAEPIKAFYQEMTADDSIEIMLTHIRTMQPSHHYLINLFSFPEFMTPTIIEVHEKVLVIFRPYHNNAKILFGWMSNDTFFEFNDTSISHYNISYPRTTFGYLEIQNDPKALLIRTATMRHQYPHHVTAHHTEGHEVFLSYSSGNGATCINHFVRLFIPSAAAINHAITTNNPVTPQAVFSKPNQLYYSEGGKFQKNWVAFEYKTKLLLIERINPMHVMELVADGDGPENAKEVMAEVRTLHKMNKVNLPWNPRYGSELRGGTHAILVHTRPLKDRNTRTLHTESNSRNSSSTSSRTSFSTIPNTGTKSENSTSSTGFGTRIRSAAGGALHRRLLPTRGRTVAINADYVYNSSFVDVNAYVETEDTVYLSFFHTRSIPTSPYYGNLNTYFMGAMTHCNRPPFQIHSMSSEPIVLDENEYRVAWFTNRINYVVYPTGLMLSKSNPNNVILSYCTQDRDGRIATLDLHRLLASLTFVANCSTA